MKYKICILGESGYLGNYLLEFFKKKNYQVFGQKIPRPNHDFKLDEFYTSFIQDLLTKINDFDLILNCAGSIECKTKSDFFFNSKFDIIFQKVIIKNNLKIKYFIFNSTKVFTSGADNYALSKKLLNNKIENSKNFYNLYIDLVFEKNSPHFNTIKEILEKIKLFIVPVFFPGKIFYPISLIQVAETIHNIILENYLLNKFILIGDKKIFFYELINYVKNECNIKKKIFYVPSKIINLLPDFMKKYFFKSKSLQQFENYDWLKNIKTSEYLIRSKNNRF